MKIIIRPHTPKEEFNYLSYVTNKLPFFEKNNCNISLPKHPNLRKAFTPEDSQLFDFFVNEEYETAFFKPGVDYLESKKNFIEKCSKNLEKYKNLWDFKTFDEYNVCLTKYGPGGSYDPRFGKIIMLTRKDGSFLKKAAEGTVLHEIVHIGIQGRIVNKYNLSQVEKEAVVDLFMKIIWGELLVNYSISNRNNSLKKYITDIKDFDELPTIIEKYVMDFPRTNS